MAHSQIFLSCFWVAMCLVMPFGLVFQEGFQVCLFALLNNPCQRMIWQCEIHYLGQLHISAINTNCVNGKYQIWIETSQVTFPYIYLWRRKVCLKFSRTCSTLSMMIRVETSRSCALNHSFSRCFTGALLSCWYVLNIVFGRVFLKNKILVESDHCFLGGSKE